MFFYLLKNIKFNGTLEIVDFKNTSHIFGNKNPYVKVKFKSKSIERKLVRNPSLYLGEGYMNDEIIVLEGTIEEFIDMITLCYDDFLKNNIFFNLYENISSYILSLGSVPEQKLLAANTPAPCMRRSGSFCILSYKW